MTGYDPGVPQPPSGPPPGWYNDPGGEPALRWWDGNQWTQHTRPAWEPQHGTAPQPAGAAAESTEPAPGRHAAAPHARPRRSKRTKAVIGFGALLAALAALIIIADVTGTNSSGTPTAGASSSAPSAAPSAVPSASAAASSAPCTTDSCIATELDQSLKGAIAQDEAVATKVDCKPSTVKNEGSGNWTARCTAYYSDGTSAEGYGTVDTSQDKVTFEPDGD